MIHERGPCGTDGVGNRAYCAHCYLCPECDGTGSKNGPYFTLVKCKRCEGVGRLDGATGFPSLTVGDEGDKRCGPYIRRD